MWQSSPFFVSIIVIVIIIIIAIIIIIVIIIITIIIMNSSQPLFVCDRLLPGDESTSNTEPLSTTFHKWFQPNWYIVFLWLWKMYFSDYENLFFWICNMRSSRASMYNIPQMVPAKLIHSIFLIMKTVSDYEGLFLWICKMYLSHRASPTNGTSQIVCLQNVNNKNM